MLLFIMGASMSWFIGSILTFKLWTFLNKPEECEACRRYVNKSHFVMREVCY